MKSVLRFFLFAFAAIGLLVVTFVVLVVWSAAGAMQEPRRVQEGSILVFDLARPLAPGADDPDPAQRLASRLFEDGGARISFFAAIDGLRRAAADSRIRGLFLHGAAEPGLGWAQLEELRAAVAAFASAGKPVRALLEVASERELFVAGAARPLVLHPLGIVEMNGFVARRVHFKRALESLGVSVQVSRVGRYKSAVEPFLQQEMSDAAREQEQALLAGLRERFVAGLAEGRGLDPSQVNDLLARGLLLPDEAVAAGVVDEVGTMADAFTALKSLSGAAAAARTFRQVSLADYAHAGGGDLGLLAPSAPDVLVLTAAGEIVDGESSEAFGTVGGATLARALRDARMDPAVRAVVLRVDSPGGSATASEVIRDEVEKLAAAKPVVVSMGNVAASGGYWISCGATRVFAGAATVTGSIGVFGLFPDARGLVEKLGVDVHAITTDPLALLLSPLHHRSDAEMAVLQGMIDHVYDGFVARVAAARKLSAEGVRESAEGRVWSGTAALERGLVDELGGLADAVAHAAEAAGLEEYRAGGPVERQEFLEALLESLGEREPDELTRVLRAFDGLGVADLAARLGGAAAHLRGGVLARLPFDVEFD